MIFYKSLVKATKYCHGAFVKMGWKWFDNDEPTEKDIRKVFLDLKRNKDKNTICSSTGRLLVTWIYDTREIIYSLSIDSAEEYTDRLENEI